jgi:hypothetical protein
LVEHVSIADPNIHEPKGVASAASGTTYLADGVGSGSWVHKTPTNEVLVQSASDFPTAAAGVITLAANTVYRISGAVDVGSDIFTVSDNVTIVGSNRDIDTVTTSSSGTMFTCTTASFRCKGVGFVISSGTFISASGSSDNHSFREVSVTCDTGGTFTSNNNTDMWRSVFNMTTTGFTFSGTCGRYVVEDSTLDVDTAAGICVDFGTATFDSIYVSNCTINNAASVTGFDIAAGGANLNADSLGYILQTDFETAASSTAGFTNGDDRWVINQNIGLANNAGSAQGSVTGNATTTTFAGTGAGNDVIVNISTNFVADEENKFSIATDGQITYTAEASVKVLVDAFIFAEIGGGSSRQYNYYIAKNGTIIESSVSKNEYDGSNPGANSVKSLVELDQNDVISIRVRAETATTALTVETMSITVIQTGA